MRLAQPRAVSSRPRPRQRTGSDRAPYSLRAPTPGARSDTLRPAQTSDCTSRRPSPWACLLGSDPFSRLFDGTWSRLLSTEPRSLPQCMHHPLVRSSLKSFNWSKSASPIPAAQGALTYTRDQITTLEATRRYSAPRAAIALAAPRKARPDLGSASRQPEWPRRSSLGRSGGIETPACLLSSRSGAARLKRPAAATRVRP